MKDYILNYLKAASEYHVTDIHITLESSYGLIKFRQKGRMITKDKIEIHEYKRLINFLKFTAELDINEHKIPQSGKAFFEVDDRVIAVRISTLPTTLMNEIIVIRVLDALEELSSEELFYHPDKYKFLKEYMAQNQGLILFTGPTGSGKSTVMYRLSKEVIEEGDRQIISIEDPIEFDIDGMVQVEINEKAMMDYGPLLRGVLRCDPDIIMFGEIRDKKVASELLKASLSGHLVISTFHSKSTKSTLSRLKEYGLYKEEMGESISLIVNQRIIHTRTKSYIVYEYMTNHEIRKFLNDEDVTVHTLNDELNILYETGLLGDEEFKDYTDKFK